jgi:hypothetical protein
MVKVATHESFDARFDVKRGSDRSFGRIIACFFVLLGLWPMLHLQMPRWGLLVAAVVVFALAVALPVALHPFNLVWFRIGLLLNKVVTPVIMGVLFYLVVTPTGVAMRLFGKSPLPLKPDPAANSYWIERNPSGPAPQSMKHQF